MRLALAVLVALAAPAASSPHDDHPAHHAAHHEEPVAKDEAPPATWTMDAPDPEPPSTVGRSVAFGAAGVAVAGGLAAFAYPRLRVLAGAALFTRTPRERLLDHPVRRALYARLETEPGATVADLAGRSAVVRTTVTHHLRALERAGLVVRRRDGRATRWRRAGQDLAAAPRLAALAHPNGRALAEAVRDSPGADQTTLARRIGVSSSLACWHLGRLEAAGVVLKMRDGPRVRYYPA